MTAIPPPPGVDPETGQPEQTDFEKAFVAAFDGEELQEEPSEETAEEEPEEEQPEAEEEVEISEEEGEEGESAGEPVEGEPATQEAGSPSTYSLGGRELTEDQIRQAVQLNDWMTGLPVEAIQAFDALLTGQYQLVPVQQIQQLQQQQQQMQTPQ